MWYGQYKHTLDSKDRFILPSRFREKMKGFKDKRFYFTFGLENCLFLFHIDKWKELEEKLQSLAFTKKESRFFNRLYFSGAQEIEADSQGRIIVPKHLKDFSRIKREIIILGVGDRIEVWDKGEWDQFYHDNRSKFEDIAENLFD